MPSYGLLEKLMTRWKSTGLWARLEAAKTVVVEPREAGKGFEDAMATYYTAVRTGKGGLFMAVCRGKASEGIDFADDHARGVILLGIPFPAIKDTKVKLKKEYNDAGSGPASGRPPSQRLLTGDAWYNQQAFRALNQAVGRCIRHKYDWGAIILLDERFRSNQLQQQLSRWVRTAVKVQDNFNMSLAELSAFCRGLVADPPRPNMQQPQDPPAEGPGTAAAGAGEPLKASLAPGAAKRTEVAGSRQRGQKGSKGSVDLQYEEDVVSPSDLPGMVVGGAIRTHFDRFRLAAGTSPGKGRNPAATGKTDKENTSARPITSFFSSAGGMSMMAQQVDTSRAAGAAAVASSCCGGGKGFGGGAGMVGGCGDKGPGCIIGNPGDTAHEPTLRTSNGLEPLSMHTQLTTQRYQPPQPGPKPGDTRTHHAVGPMQPLEAVHHQQGHPRDQQTQQEPELQRSPLQQHKQPWSERRGAVPVDVADMQYPSMQSGDHHPQYQPFLPAGGADGGCVSNANLQSVSSPTGAGSPEPALAPASHCSPAALEPSFRPPLPRQTPPTYSTPPYGAAELLQGKAPGPPPPHSPCQQHQQQPPERQQYSWSGQPHQWQYQRQWLTPQQQQQQQQQQQPPNFQGSHTAYSHAPQYPWQRQGHDGQVPHGTSATWGGEPGEGQGRMQLQHQWKGPEDQQHRSWDGNMPYWQTQPQPQSQPQGNTQLQGQEQGQWWRAARQDLSCQGTRLENQHEDQQPPPPLQQPPGLPYNRRSPPSRLQANPRAPAWVSTSVPLPAATALQQGPPSFRQQPGAQSTPQQAQQGACLEQHPRHSEFIRERAAGVSQVAIPFQHASAQPRPAQPSPLQWQLPPGPLQQNQTQYPSKPSQQPQWQPPPRQYQHQQYQQYQHQHQQLPLQYRRLGCESASGSGAHSDDCGGQQQVGRYPDEQAQKQEPKSLPYQQLNQPQQAFAGQSGAAGQGVTDDREPSREGGVSGQRVISTTTYGGHISACREVVGTGAGPNNIAAASSWQPGSTMGIGGRPLKKLTSSRAREAAKKRRRVNQENGTGQGPGNGSQWDSIDEEDDFV
ncbi:hypothetical protein Vafri_11262 [Volvox africanus]|nr:hypothetical protein Vafri_11262 [Volvox africanus]